LTESQKQHEIEPQLPQNVNRKSYALYCMVTFPVTLMDS